MTLVSTPDNAIPAGAIAGKIKTPDGIELRFARWDSIGGNRGTVCVFQGRTEFIEKYFEAVNELRKHGFVVATMDWRGQGHSSRQLPNPRKGHVKSLAEFEADVDAFMQQVVLPDCPPPYFALAHSMGGAALVRVAHSGKQKFERYVLSAPMIDLHGLNGSFVARALARTKRFLAFMTSICRAVTSMGPGTSSMETISPTIPCASHAMKRLSRRIQRLRLADPQWPG